MSEKTLITQETGMLRGTVEQHDCITGYELKESLVKTGSLSLVTDRPELRFHYKGDQYSIHLAKDVWDKMKNVYDV